MHANEREFEGKGGRSFFCASEAEPFSKHALGELAIELNPCEGTGKR
jgi:hypothetical protein